MTNIYRVGNYVNIIPCDLEVEDCDCHCRHLLGENLRLPQNSIAVEKYYTWGNFTLFEKIFVREIRRHPRSCGR